MRHRGGGLGNRSEDPKQVLTNMFQFCLHHRTNLVCRIHYSGCLERSDSPSRKPGNSIGIFLFWSGNRFEIKQTTKALCSSWKSDEGFGNGVRFGTMVRLFLICDVVHMRIHPNAWLPIATCPEGFPLTGNELNTKEGSIAG